MWILKVNGGIVLRDINRSYVDVYSRAFKQNPANDIEIFEEVNGVIEGVFRVLPETHIHVTRKRGLTRSAKQLARFKITRGCKHRRLACTRMVLSAKKD